MKRNWLSVRDVAPTRRAAGLPGPRDAGILHAFLPGTSISRVCPPSGPFTRSPGACIRRKARSVRRIVPTVYSHSRLSSFENCPRQFYYRYVEKVPVETESIEAFVGKRVHEVIERLNRFVERGLVPSLGKVLARFQALWDEHFAPERVRIVRAENPPESYRQMGERCLTNHYRRNYPFDADESLGIEQHVSFALDADGRYRMPH